MFPASRCICVLVSTLLAENYCKWTSLSDRQYFCTTCVLCVHVQWLWGDSVQYNLTAYFRDHRQIASCILSATTVLGCTGFVLWAFKTSQAPAKFCVLCTNSTFMDHLHCTTSHTGLSPVQPCFQHEYEPVFSVSTIPGRKSQVASWSDCKFFSQASTTRFESILRGSFVSWACL